MSRYAEYYSPYAPETCSEEGHVPGCAGAAGGEHEYVVTRKDVLRRLNAMRCEVCGHRLDDLGGCDSCAADREAQEWDDAAG